MNDKDTAQPKETEQAKEVKPDQKSRRVEDIILETLQKCVFQFNFRNRYRVNSQYVIAPDLQIAVERCERYCERFRLKFVSVHPIFLDLTYQPPDRTGRQQPDEEFVPPLEQKIKLT